ncbi:DUF2441 domain-containing protein [Cupriavidus metallidurans]|uniref:DUF2441 domain-containing protein n=1 Tax=Cupriavidus metallidurans TaxID=119219 RepID=UPI001319BE44|nr:DUF2441 domain-containing protein [Cupriavidus metallidurans]
MSRLFFVARSRHAPGDTLGAGHFGAGFKRYRYDAQTMGGAQAAWRLASELLVENVRRARFPSLPSRFECSFAFNDEDHALAEMADGTFLHEVRLVNPGASTHVAGFNLMSSYRRFAVDQDFIEMTEAIADAYWSGRDIIVPEVLSLSPLEVVSCLS